VSKPNKAEYAGFQSSLCRRQGIRLKTEEKKKMQEKQNFMDLESIMKELDEEFAVEAGDQPKESVDEPEIVEEEEVLYDEEEVLDTEEETTEDIIEPTPNADDIHKRNEAFRKLREERDQLASSDSFLNELAKQYNLTKEQLMERFREDQLKKQAKEQGIPESQLRKIQEMERRLEEVESSKNREVFNIKAETLAAKYKLNETDMTNLFREASNLGIDILRNPNLLEFAYRAINYDNAINEGRQRQLETSKKRSQTSTGKTGTQGSEVSVSQEEGWDKEIDALLKDLKI